MSEVLIIGGGAAGMMAAIAAAKNGHHVVLAEKNEKLGKKIYITGKGRCNLTNNADLDVILANVVSNSRFLYSALYGFTNQDMIRMMNEAGLETKVERGNRVFPVSDKSSDVIKALTGLLKKYGVKVLLHAEAQKLIIEKDSDNSDVYVCKGAVLKKVTGSERTRGRMADGSFNEQTGNRMSEGEKAAPASRLHEGERTTAGQQWSQRADVTIVACGGLSYPLTGSTGDGYKFAEEAGHQITELSPALVPFTTKEEWVPELQGLALRNVKVHITAGKKKLYEEFGEMLFTHFGVSGPAVLSGSSVCAKQLKKRGELTLHIDLKPALDEHTLDERLLREFKDARNKQIRNVAGSLYPSSLVPVMLRISGIPEDKPIHDITKQERAALIANTKDLRITLTGLRDYNEAIITQGGVKVKEINPTTMESKLVPGLKFAGEVLDLDAMTGGYNLQIAWSTGWAAGSTI